jgi:hypothetical protein
VCVLQFKHVVSECWSVLKCDIRSAAYECYLQEADETLISDEVQLKSSDVVS